MADTDLGAAEAPEYDVTIPTPPRNADDGADGSGVERDPANPESDSDAPPAGDQPAADGALGGDGVPLRADGTPARDKGEVA